MCSIRFVIRDGVWEQITPHLSEKTTDVGVMARDNWLFVGGVLWHVRTGSPRFSLPDVFGD